MLTAARSSLADKSADLSLTMTMNVAGSGKNLTVTASGSGSVDFTTGDADATVTYQGIPELSGTQIHEIAAGGQTYLQFSGPAFAELGLADQWVATPTVRQVRTDPTASLGGMDMTGTVVETFTNFGTPVSVTAPPADQVISLQQFEQEAGSVAGQTS